ncbi:hypothetical protein [Lysinibacillus zambalensis]
MFFARKRSANVATAEGFGFVAKAQRQHDVGHEGVITGCDGFSLRSSISLIPKESPSRNEDQLTYIWHTFNKCHPQNLAIELNFHVY